MIIALVVSGSVGMFALGCVVFTRQRRELRSAMEAEGFKKHEVQKAMRLHARREYEKFDEQCRAVRERRARTDGLDWTKPESYREFV